jgi:hypothetical protein
MANEIEESLRAFLLTLSAVTDLTGTGALARIRPDRLEFREVIPADKAAVIIEVDSERPLNTLDGLGGRVYDDVNLKCRSTQKKVARELAEAIRTNGTDPGTGLAGYHGAAGTQTIDAVLEDMETSFNTADDASEQGYFDVDCHYVISYPETV